MHTIDVLIAKYLIGICGLIALYVWWRQPKSKKVQFAVEAIIGGILTLILAKLASKFYYNPRPFVVGNFTPWFSHGNDNGFPSDHTLLSSFMGYVTLRYSRKWGFILLGLAAVIGLSRVFAGVHHVIDIVGSFVIAGISVAIVYWVGKPVTTAKNNENAKQ